MYFGSLFPLPLPLVIWQVARIALRSGGACSLRARRHIYASPSYFQQKVSALMCAFGAAYNSSLLFITQLSMGGCAL